MTTAGPFIGPRGGLWADAAHTIPWKRPEGHKGNPWRDHLGHLKLSKYPPPGAVDATVDTSGDIHSHAVIVWKDEKGRRQAGYTEAFIARNAAAKWERVGRLMQKVDALLEAVDGAWKAGGEGAEESAALAVIYRTGLRIGSKAGEKATGNRGVSTLRGENVVDHGTHVELDFVGKEHVRNRAVIADPALAAELRRRKAAAGDGGALFSTVDAKVRKAWDDVAGGMKVKDLRTYVATVAAANALASNQPPPPLPADAKKAKALIKKRLADASKSVAETINNTPAVAKSSYIHPAIIDEWLRRIGGTSDMLAKSTPVLDAMTLLRAALARPMPAKGPIAAAEEENLEYPLPRRLHWIDEDDMKKSFDAIVERGEDLFKAKRGKGDDRQLGLFSPPQKQEPAAHSGGPFYGPRGGKWADAKRTIPWTDPDHQAAAAHHRQEMHRHPKGSPAEEAHYHAHVAHDTAHRTGNRFGDGERLSHRAQEATRHAESFGKVSDAQAAQNTRDRYAEKHVYGAALRPISHATVPEGHAEIGSHKDFPHGTVTYSSPLDPARARRLDLIKIPSDADKKAAAAEAFNEMKEYASEHLEEHRDDPKSFDMAVGHFIDKHNLHMKREELAPIVAKMLEAHAHAPAKAHKDFPHHKSERQRRAGEHQKLAEVDQKKVSEHTKKAAEHRNKASEISGHAKGERNQGKLYDLTEAITAHQNAASAHDEAASSHRNKWDDAEKLSAKAEKKSADAPMRHWHDIGTESGWVDHRGYLHSHPTAPSEINKDGPPEPKVDPHHKSEMQRRAGDHRKIAEHHKKVRDRLHKFGVKDSHGFSLEDHQQAYEKHQAAVNALDRASFDPAHADRAKEASAAAHNASDRMHNEIRKRAEGHRIKAEQHRQKAREGGTEEFQAAHRGASESHREAYDAHYESGSILDSGKLSNASMKAKGASDEIEMNDLDTPEGSHRKAAHRHYAKAVEHRDLARKVERVGRPGSPTRKKHDALHAAHSQAAMAHSQAAHVHESAVDVHITARKAPGYGGKDGPHRSSHFANAETKKAHDISAHVERTGRPVPRLPERDSHGHGKEAEYHSAHADYHNYRAESDPDPDKVKAHKKAAAAHKRAATVRRGLPVDVETTNDYKIARTKAHVATEDAEKFGKGLVDDMHKSSVDFRVEGLPFNLSDRPCESAVLAEQSMGMDIAEITDVRQAGANGGLPGEDDDGHRAIVYDEPETVIVNARASGEPYGRSY